MTTRAASLLVVDDEELNRDMLSQRLELNGYTVTAVESGRQALAFLNRHSFDVVLLDVMMPEMNGLDVLRMVRRTQSAAELPIIMVTARDQSEDVVEAFELGANDYVTKPIDLPVVLARIATQVSHKRRMQHFARARHGTPWPPAVRTMACGTGTSEPMRSFLAALEGDARVRGR